MWRAIVRGVRRDDLRIDALVAADKDVVRVRRAAISTASPRTLISQRLARRIARDFGRRACVGAGAVLGAFCGPTVKADIVANDCRAATVRAIVSPDLPRGLDLVIGRDVTSRTVGSIGVEHGRVVLRCKR